MTIKQGTDYLIYVWCVLERWGGVGLVGGAGFFINN